MPNPNLGLDRPYVRLADMNGDRIQDLVWVQSDQCTWYPGKGFGEFGAPVPMANPPFGVLDETRLLLADVNGDGLSDAIYVSTGTFRVWINLGLDPADPTRARFANPDPVTGQSVDALTAFHSYLKSIAPHVKPTWGTNKEVVRLQFSTVRPNLQGIFFSPDRGKIR